VRVVQRRLLPEAEGTGLLAQVRALSRGSHR